MKNLILSIAALALPALVVMFLIVSNAQSPSAVMGAFAALIATTLAGAGFLAVRFAGRVKAEGFDEGMQTLADSAPFLFNQFSVRGAPVYCNREAVKAFEARDRQECYDKIFTHLIPEFQPDGRRSTDVVGEHTQKAMRDGSSQAELWHQTLGGDKLPLRCSLVKARLRGEDYLLIFSSDIRKELEAEKKEAALKERMQAILDASPLLCAVYDEEGNALEVNKEAENMFGIPDKRIFASQYNDFLPPCQPDGSDSMQKSAEMITRTIRDGHSRYEWMYQRRDGTPLPTEEIMQCIKIDGKTQVIAYSRDLREFYAAKEAEQAAQKRVNEMMDKLNNQLETQSSAITESSAAIEEMIANIRSVSNTLSKNAENVKELQSASEVGHAGLNEVASDIMEIARESESLLGINSVMENIASQTNLLSMNAAIEAAHAGDSGRGFAVVAGEIRKLAESSSQQSKTINAVLKNIKGSIDKITKSTGSVMEKFTAIDGGVKTVAQQEQGVMNAMTEQGAGSTQIMQAIAQVNDITHQVKADAQQMIEAAAKLGA